MSIRTTVSLDEDVIARLKSESASRSIPFKKIINDAIRSGLTAMNANKRSDSFEVVPFSLGTYPDLNYDNIGELIEIAEGPAWR